MNANTIVTASRRRRFGDSTPALFMQPVPVSPMVLQSMAEAMFQLNQKVDALAHRLNTPVVHPMELPVMRAELATSKQIEIREVRNDLPKELPRVKVNRSRLLDIFD